MFIDFLFFRFEKNLNKEINEKEEEAKDRFN